MGPTAVLPAHSGIAWEFLHTGTESAECAHTLGSTGMAPGTSCVTGTPCPPWNLSLASDWTEDACSPQGLSSQLVRKWGLPTASILHSCHPVGPGGRGMGGPRGGQVPP